MNSAWGADFSFPHRNKRQGPVGWPKVTQKGRVLFYVASATAYSALDG